MKKSLKSILLVVGVIVLLGAAILILTLTENCGSAELSGSDVSSEDATSSETPLIKLFSRSSSDMVSMNITNESGTYTILSEVTPSEDSSSSDTVSFRIQGFDGAEISSSTVSTLAAYGYYLAASREIVSGELSETQLAQYGLDAPKLTVDSVFTDGSTFRFFVGNASPTGSGYYVMVDGSSSVYLSALSSSLFSDPLSFIDTTVLTITAPSDSTTGTNTFTAFSFSGKNFPKKVVIGENPTGTLFYAFYILEPTEASANDDKISAIQTQLASITATGAAAVNPDAQQLIDFGLATPYVTLSFTVNGENHTLKLGNETGSARYLMIDEDPTVYIVAKTAVDSWSEMSYFSLRSSLVYLTMLSDVNKVTVNISGTDHVFSLTRTEDEDATSSSDEISYIYRVFLSDKTEILYSSFQKYYQSLLAIALFEEDYSTPTGSPDLSITYEYYDGHTPDVVSYYKSGDRRYLAVVNGEVQGLVKSTAIEEVIDYTEDIKAATVS